MTIVPRPLVPRLSARCASRRLALLFPLVFVPPLASACTEPEVPPSTPAEIVPVDEGEDDLTDASALLGDYEDASKGQRGLFQTLRFARVIVDRKQKNRFEGLRRGACAQGPCEAKAVEGAWFARGGRVSLYFGDGDQLSARFTLQGGELALRDAKGGVLAKLSKRTVSPNGVERILTKHGVPNIAVQFDAAAITKHGKPKVPFTTAFDQAVSLFLTGEDGLSGVAADRSIEELAATCPSKSAKTREEGVVCVANRRTTTVDLFVPDDETPPGDESPEESWIFGFFTALSDHGFYAIVPKDGGEASIYSFN